MVMLTPIGDVRNVEDRQVSMRGTCMILQISVHIVAQKWMVKRMAEIIHRELFNENGEVVGYEYRGRLVRCKDCIYHEDEDLKTVYCPNIVGSWVDYDFYCRDGKVKNNG